MAVMPASVAEATNAGWSLALVLVRAYYSLVNFRTCSKFPERRRCCCCCWCNRYLMKRGITQGNKRVVTAAVAQESVYIGVGTIVFVIVIATVVLGVI